MITLRGGSAVAAGVLLVLLVTSCAGPAPTASDASHVPAPSASPSEPAKPPLVIQRPPSQFPVAGCTDLIPAERFMTVTGYTPVLDTTTYLTMPTEYALDEQAGVIDCVWNTGAGSVNDQ